MEIRDFSSRELRVKRGGIWTSEKSNKVRKGLVQFAREAFLPDGFPSSVAPDYTPYQIYDTLQAFCSNITGLLATRAVFQRVGVGNSEATATAATLTWVLQDATAMVGRILFTWRTAFFLDADVKQWRFMADILNDSATFIDVLTPLLSKKYFVWIACLSTLLKALCGVAGGSTKAALSQHFAIRDNVADLNAKDGSQETIVGLVGMLVGSYLVHSIPHDNHLLVWLSFIVFTTLHLVFNYCGVRSVVIKTVNSQRAEILFAHFLDAGEQGSRTVLSPASVASVERIFYFGQNFRHIKVHLGVKLESVLNELGADDEDKLDRLSRSQHVLAFSKSNSSVIVALRDGSLAYDILRAYFHATLVRRHIEKNGPDTMLQHLESSLDEMFDEFMSGLRQSGWRVDDGNRTRIRTGEWRWSLKAE